MGLDENRDSSFIKRNWLQVVLAVVPPLVIWFWLQRERTSLSIAVITDTPVVSVDGKYSGDIAVSYKGGPVTALRVVEIELKNTGTTPIDERDFDKGSELAFSFADPLATPTAIRSEPSVLAKTARVSVAPGAGAKTLLLEPLMLNPADSLVVQVFVLGEKGARDLTVSGHIKGVVSLTPTLISQEPGYHVLGLRLQSRDLGFVLAVYVAFLAASIAYLRSIRRLRSAYRENETRLQMLEAKASYLEALRAGLVHGELPSVGDAGETAAERHERNRNRYD